MGFCLMSSENFPTASLDVRQESEIADVILELRGAALSRSTFGEELCQILEDIPGFENPTPEILEDLVQRLWIKYKAK
jgi:hypothetical protein